MGGLVPPPPPPMFANERERERGKSWRKKAHLEKFCLKEKERKKHTPRLIQTEMTCMPLVALEMEPPAVRSVSP